MILGAEKQVLILLTFVLFDVGLSVECSHMTDTIGWSLSAVCWDKSFNRPISCQWYVALEKKNIRVKPLQSSPSFDTFFNCSGKLPLPLSTGEYIYRILLANDTLDKAFNLRIDDPGELTVKNCKHEVSEGDNVTCVCSTQREGSPPPAISWVGQTSSTLHLYDVTGDDSKTYTCKMIWGRQTKTVSHDLLVRSSEEQDNSSFTSVIFITVAAVLVITIVTTIILIVIIRRKRRSETTQSAKNKEQGILSQHSCSNSGDGEEELIENRYYGGFDIADVGDLKNVDDYAEVMEAKSMDPDLYAGIEENNERQTTEPVRYVEANKGRQAAQVEVYACVEKNKERQPIQPELYATVVKFSGKEQSKTDNSRLQKDFSNEENVYTIVDKGAKPESHVLSAPIEEMYAQVVKSPK